MGAIVPDYPGLAELRVHVRGETVVPVTRAIADDMTRYVPVLTGDLRSTITPDASTTSDTGRVWFGGEAASGEYVDYHLYVEYGTRYMAAQPYARPAAYTPREL
ncbi:MAG TPA: hypothetical protein VFU47_12905 [Armatimonadota bacterium]|nr:hypothetical protein [Armatimonadota bacterium]